MMIEAAEVIVPLLRGETVSHTADWFRLEEARLQLLPFNPDGIEVGVASTFSPVGCDARRAAGSVAPVGRGQRPAAVSTRSTRTGGSASRSRRPTDASVDRQRWRVVASMHLAETREQAERDVEHGVLGLTHYMEGMGGTKVPWSSSAQYAHEWWSTEGFPVFGVVTLGTPDDALSTIRALVEKTGGFGTFLLLAHNCAPWDATKRSYEMFAEYVMPELRRANVNRDASIAWAGRERREVHGCDVAGDR